MYTKKIKTPALVQITFIAFFLVMMTPFLVLVASASPLDNYCQRQYSLNRFWPLLPVAYKKCWVLFEKYTEEWYSGLYSNK